MVQEQPPLHHLYISLQSNTLNYFVSVCDSRSLQFGEGKHNSFHSNWDTYINKPGTKTTSAMDDSLLCDEVLVFTPPNVTREVSNSNDGWRSSEWTTCSSAPLRCREDFEESVRTLVEKERNHMPQPGYAKYLESNPLVYNARFNAISAGMGVLYD